MLAGISGFALFLLKMHASNAYYHLLVRCKLRKLFLILKFPKEYFEEIDSDFNLLIQQ
jgi:hypothetical protein